MCHYLNVPTSFDPDEVNLIDKFAKVREIIILKGEVRFVI